MKKKKLRKRKLAAKLRKKRHVPKIERKKIVFLVIDGLADLSMNNNTPLKEALKPNLDWLAKHGLVGEILPVEKSLWSDQTNASVSHIGNLSLLGYNPKKYRVKRGPLEAVGTGLPYTEGHLALRCNFATVDKELRLLDRRVGRNSLGLDDLVRYVNEHVDIGARFILIRTFEHRAVLIIKEKLSDKITHSDPFVVGERLKPVEALIPEAQKSAKLVQDFINKSREVIEFHPANELRIKHGLPPANIIITREAGNKLIALPSFVKKHKLKNAVCIAENSVMKATCMLAGFDSVNVSEMKYETTLKFIFDNISDLIADYDFIYAHIKGVDEAGHDGDFHRKRDMIERIDEKLKMFKNFNGILVVTTDHITSCALRQHMFGAVPLLVYGKDRGNIKTFDEFSAKKGKLRNYTGTKLWKLVLRK